MSFYIRHVCNAYLKSTFIDAWEKVPQFLENTSSHRFRNYYEDVSQSLMRSWQLSSGNFHPRTPDFGRYYGLTSMSHVKLAINAVRKHKNKAICLNDGVAEGIDFYTVKDSIQKAYQETLPEKSMFEL